MVVSLVRFALKVWCQRFLGSSLAMVAAATIFRSVNRLFMMAMPTVWKTARANARTSPVAASSFTIGKMERGHSVWLGLTLWAAPNLMPEEKATVALGVTTECTATPLFARPLTSLCDFSVWCPMSQFQTISVFGLRLVDRTTAFFAV